jgi:cobalt-zinc-cadmium efflux system outer membrane protein
VSLAAAPGSSATDTSAPGQKPASALVRLPDTKQVVTRGRRRFEGVQVSAATQPHYLTRVPQTPEPIPPGSGDLQRATTLDELTEIALANSPQIREAENQAAAARARALQASLYPNPTFGTASPQLAGNQSQYNAYVIQDLVTRNKIGLDTAAASRMAREAELAAVRARFDVLTLVRQRFYTALIAERKVTVLNSMVTIARTSLDISERLLKAEAGTRGDVLLLQIEYSRADAELKNAYTLAAITKRQLAAAVGLMDMPIARVEGDLRHPLPDYDLVALQQAVIARNATAQSAEVEISRTQFVLRRAVVEPFPNLNMLGGIQNQQPGAQAPETQGLYQVQVIVPLWNRNQGNIRAAQSSVGAAVAQLNRVEMELANASAEALGRYITARQLVERFERIVLPSAIELQDISEQLYRQGQIEFLLYLNSQRALITANLDYLSAQSAQWLAAAEVAGLLQSERFP